MMANILSIGGGDNPATFELIPYSKRPRYSNTAVTYSTLIEQSWLFVHETTSSYIILSRKILNKMVSKLLKFLGRKMGMPPYRQAACMITSNTLILPVKLSTSLIRLLYHLCYKYNIHFSPSQFSNFG